MQKAATVLENKKLEIIDIWVEKVREALPASVQTPDPVLRDHLPLLLDDIGNILKRFENFEFSSELSNFDGMLDTSLGHGRHRSTSSGYDVEQVLKEYIILHKVITKELRKANVYSEDVADVLKYIIENSMLYGIVAFVNSLREVQQKLTGVLAHDIRNPASAAYLGIGMIKQDDPPERFEKIKEMTRKSLKRSLGLIEELLESVKVEAGEGITFHFSERELAKYIKSVADDASEIYPNKIILNCKEDEILGVFDTAMIRRILENIINNAVKYGERGTPVTISVEDQQEKVIINIHNQGNPIAHEDQKEIFQFLKTTNGSGPREIKSWGMGLTLVNSVARAHGGSLHLKSNKKEGTTFSIVLDKTANEPGKKKTSLNFS